MDKHTWTRFGDSPEVSDPEESDEAGQRTRKAGRAKKGKEPAKPAEATTEKGKVRDAGMGALSAHKSTVQSIPDKAEEQEGSSEEPSAQHTESSLSSSDPDDSDQDGGKDLASVAHQSSFQKRKFQSHFSIISEYSYYTI